MSILDLTMHFRELKARKQIAGKHCFSDPDEASPGRPLESDPGAENSHLLQHTKMRCCDMLVFGLRPQAIPCRFCADRSVPVSYIYRLHGNPQFKISKRWQTMPTAKAGYRPRFRLVEENLRISL